MLIILCLAGLCFSNPAFGADAEQAATNQVHSNVVTNDLVAVALRTHTKEAWQAALYQEIEADSNIDAEMGVNPTSAVVAVTAIALLIYGLMSRHKPLIIASFIILTGACLFAWVVNNTWWTFRFMGYFVLAYGLVFAGFKFFRIRHRPTIVNTKIIYTIVWMLVFKLVFFYLICWTVATLDHFHRGTKPPGHHPPAALTILIMGLFALMQISPLIALVLSIYGLLPGTKVKADKKKTA